jgi:glucose/arabinose dehydrogenase
MRLTLDRLWLGGAWGVVASLCLAAPACTRAERDANSPSANPGADPPPAGSASPARDLASATPDNPLRPEEPSQIVPTSNGPGVNGGAPKLERLKLPPGFEVQLYSGDVPHARSLALGRKGTVFVSTRRDDKVYALVDENGDHRVDRALVVARGLDTPNGIAYRDGALYIAETSRLLRLDGIDTRLAEPPKPVVVSDKLPEREHHGWRYIRFGPDGWLYIPIGAPCNVCDAPEPIFATIARRANGSGLEVFASGVRNSLGFDWHPQTKELWFTENGRDGMSDELPPDELNRAPKPGLNFGFPECHAGVILCALSRRRPHRRARFMESQRENGLSRDGGAAGRQSRCLI